jgi:hypothetical protein
MSHKIHVILVFTCLFALRLTAQPLFSEPNFAPDFVKNEPPKMVSDTLQNIQLRISRMSNRMVWLQQKIKEDTTLDSVVREEFEAELSALIKVRGDLMQATRQLMRSQNGNGKWVLSER